MPRGEDPALDDSTGTPVTLSAGRGGDAWYRAAIKIPFLATIIDFCQPAQHFGPNRFWGAHLPFFWHAIRRVRHGAGSSFSKAVNSAKL